MYKFELWQVALISGIFLWFGFRWGTIYGRDKQQRADALHRKAMQEQDPDTRKKLLLEWSDLIENKNFRKGFKETLRENDKDGKDI